MEAWAWLHSEGLLVPDDNWFFLSRRAQRLKSRKDFEDFRKAHLLPKGQLHPLIATRVYPPFLRGEYDTAIFQAFREVEVAVRQAGQFPRNLTGDKLMRAAFNAGKNNSPSGPLADPQLPSGEQEAMAHLFAGAFGVYRNSTSHRHVPTRAEEAAEVIMFASQLLRAHACSALGFTLESLDSFLVTRDRSFLLLARRGVELMDGAEQFF